ncbi:MAG: cytokinin riboside 5'-monophosphate phosphoribohydrolase [Cyclobacteriaceae bacterium]|nr:MAG: cytokinin riboside 5'-monophosphate phosphoribohydrolase [Cyclobacteriaceae bacterium]
MKSVCVFCGSSAGISPEYIVAGRALGETLAQKGIRLIYGGAAVGIMGAVANGVLESGGQVIGIIPGFLSKKEIRHEGLTELITVDSMHQRKQKMAELSEGFIALPGGFGTLEELSEILTWAQLGLVRYPVGILNVNGYYDHLLALFDHMVSQELLKPQNRELVINHHSIDELLDQMKNYQPADVPKWLDKTRT